MFGINIQSIQKLLQNSTKNIYDMPDLYNIKQTQEVLNKISSKKTYFYSPEEALMKYIGSESFRINDALRNSKQLDNMQLAIVDALDYKLNKIPDFKAQTYRALTFEREEEMIDFINKNKVGTSILHKAYTSTSKNYNDFASMESNFNALLLVNGKHGKDISLINPLQENEVLFARNTKFNIDKLERQNNTLFGIITEI